MQAWRNDVHRFMMVQGQDVRKAGKNRCLNDIFLHYPLLVLISSAASAVRRFAISFSVFVLVNVCKFTAKKRLTYGLYDQDRR
jgi:hypothetical protein